MGVRDVWGNAALSKRFRSSCVMAVTVAAVVLAGAVAARDGAVAAPADSGSAKLTFTPGENSEYTFDTGVLRGTMRQGGRSLGLSSVTHIASGVRLDGSVGILNYYRVFTTNQRH